MGTVQEPQIRTTCLKSAGSTPPIYTAVSLPFITLQSLAGFKALKSLETPLYTSDFYCSTPPICAEVRLPFAMDAML